MPGGASLASRAAAAEVPGTMSICAWLACKSGNQAAARALWCVRPGRAVARGARGLAPTHELKRAFQSFPVLWWRTTPRQRDCSCAAATRMVSALFTARPSSGKGHGSAGRDTRDESGYLSSALAWAVSTRSETRAGRSVDEPYTFHAFAGSH
jgi:hypothetical protein